MHVILCVYKRVCVLLWYDNSVTCLENGTWRVGATRHLIKTIRKADLFGIREWTVIFAHRASVINIFMLLGCGICLWFNTWE